MQRKEWKFGRCPCCKNEEYLTVHHEWPQRHFKGEGPQVLICETCHVEIEKDIPEKIMSLEFYELILVKFGV